MRTTVLERAFVSSACVFSSFHAGLMQYKRHHGSFFFPRWETAKLASGLEAVEFMRGRRKWAKAGQPVNKGELTGKTNQTAQNPEEAPVL